MQSLILTRLALRRSKAMLSRRSNIVNYTAHSYPAFQFSAFSSESASSSASDASSKIIVTSSSSSATTSTSDVKVEKVKIAACGDVDSDDDDDGMEQEEMFVDAYKSPQFDHGQKEWGGPQRGGRLPEPTRYGDWERKGRCSDF